MDPSTGNVDTDAILKERFATLPKVVQDAITSADVQEHMRKLAESQKLHVDQWQILENNVMVTLLGFQPVADLREHLKKDLGVSDEVAAALAANISETVFKPIRSEMEQSLSHPTAVQEAASALETVRTQELAQAGNAPTAAADAPAAEPSVAPIAAPLSASPVSDEPAPIVAPEPVAPPADPAATAPAAPTPPPPAPEEKAVRAQVAQTYANTASHERRSIEGDPYREQIT